MSKQTCHEARSVRTYTANKNKKESDFFVLRMSRQWRRLCRLQILVFVSGVLLRAMNRRWKEPGSSFSTGDVDITKDSRSDWKDAMSVLELPNSLPPSQNHSLIYVHVGKTGGITLNKVLHSNCMWYYGKSERDKCLRWLKLHESSSSTKLSELTRATLHFGPRRDYEHWIQNATLFLMTLRNPIARAVSAYNFDHPSNQDPGRYAERVLPKDAHRFFVDCFPTIHDMAETLRGQKHSKMRNYEACHSIAVQTLAGNGTNDSVPHLRMNYKYYHDLSTALYPDRPLLAVRTEFLWHDLQRIDRMLGGYGAFEASGMTYTHGSPAFRVNKGLSAIEKRLFCCHLVTELQLYQDLIQRSINLLEFEKKEVLDLLYKDCGRGDETLRMSWREWVAGTGCTLR